MGLHIIMPSSRVPRTPGSILVPAVKQRLQQEWQIKFGQQKAKAAEASKLKTALLVRFKLSSPEHQCSVLLFRGRIALRFCRGPACRSLFTPGLYRLRKENLSLVFWCWVSSAFASLFIPCSEPVVDPHSLAHILREKEESAASRTRRENADKSH